MNFKNFDYNVDRTENCLLVDLDNWKEPDSKKVKYYNMRGTSHVNYITEVLAENLDTEKYGDSINSGDFVALTRVIVDIAKCRAHSLGDKRKFYDIPVMQVLGKFIDNKITYDNFMPLYDKVLLEKVDVSYSKILVTPQDNSMICRVLKVGGKRLGKDNKFHDMTVKAGDLVLIRDNVTTELEIEGKVYYATEESKVVCIFNNPSQLSLSNARIINDSIIMVQYSEPTLLGVKNLVAPKLNYELLDYSDVFNRNLLKILYIDNNIQKVKSGDVIIMNRDITNYVYFNREKYYIISGTEFIEGKKLED